MRDQGSLPSDVTSGPLPDTPAAREAATLLRSCVHCGFCTATCPTYRLLGEETDGPRGRIYLIKLLLEGEQVAEAARHHLDRCLGCRACETACPSGVKYGRLAELGRREAERLAPPRPWLQRIERRALCAVLPHPRRFAPLVALARLARPLLPRRLRAQLPPTPPALPAWPAPRHERRVLALGGCVQPVFAPGIDLAAARVLDRVGSSLLPPSGGCCGAMPLHLGDEHQARALARRNVDAWWPEVERGAEALLVTASGCGAVVKDYGQLLRDDPGYAERAARIAALARDPVELLEGEGLAALRASITRPLPRLAYQSPCSLQHAQRLGGRTEALLAALGFELTAVPDAQLCCGSAGTYSLLQPALSGRLLERKLAALEAGAPQGVASSNIGCLLHLGSQAQVPVRHWLEWLDEALAR